MMKDNFMYNIDVKGKIKKLLKELNDEVESFVDFNPTPEMIIWELYCDMNRYIASWAKEKLKNGEAIGVDDVERNVLIDFSNYMEKRMSLWSNVIEEQKGREESDS